MTKIKTPFGYLYINDDRITDNAKTAVSHMFSQQELNEIIISSPKEQNLYRTDNPFGCGYTNNYERAIATHIAMIKMSHGIPVREIEFIEVS